MRRVREIIRLAETAKMSVRMISGALGVSRPVVGEYLKQAAAADLRWAEANDLSDEALLERLSPKGPTAEEEKDPRRTALQQRLPQIISQLGKSHVTRELLWEEYRRECPEGYSYSQFCLHIQMYLGTEEISMHIKHEPGKRLLVDYAGDPPSLFAPRTGEQRKVQLFVAVFPASGLIYTEASESQTVHDFIESTRHTLEYAGGAPRIYISIIVTDNLRAAVTKADRYEPQINGSFEEFGRYYGCVVIPARVRKPRDKALVEAAVHLVYTRILAPLRSRRFSTLEQLNGAIGPLLEEVNDRVMKKIGLSRRERFGQIESERLPPRFRCGLTFFASSSRRQPCN